MKFKSLRKACDYSRAYGRGVRAEIRGKRFVIDSFGHVVSARDRNGKELQPHVVWR